jgi:hypothetical protein
VLDCPGIQECDVADLGITSAWTGTDYAPETRCVLERLAIEARDTTEVLEVGRYLNMDSPSRQTWVLDGDSRMALRQSHGYLNGSGSYRYPMEGCTLKPTSYFQACLNTPQIDCLDWGAWTEECRVADSSCPGG